MKQRTHKKFKRRKLNNERSGVRRVWSRRRRIRGERKRRKQFLLLLYGSANRHTTQRDLDLRGLTQVSV
jgi:tRNA G37 N-methylase Trm5